MSRVVALVDAAPARAHPPVRRLARPVVEQHLPEKVVLRLVGAEHHVQRVDAVPDPADAALLVRPPEVDHVVVGGAEVRLVHPEVVAVRDPELRFDRLTLVRAPGRGTT
jgi:hypothetical protein